MMHGQKNIKKSYTYRRIVTEMTKITGKLKREGKTFIVAKSGHQKGTLNSENTAHRPVQNTAHRPMQNTAHRPVQNPLLSISY
jgi:hypothetical protein